MTLGALYIWEQPLIVKRYAPLICNFRVGQREPEHILRTPLFARSGIPFAVNC